LRVATRVVAAERLADERSMAGVADVLGRIVKKLLLGEVWILGFVNRMRIGGG
jgi:hypothetical protein